MASTPSDGPSDSQAEAALALVHEGWRHVQLQRPKAAWACWQRVLRLKPGDPAATQALDALAGAEDLPQVARRPDRFKNPNRPDTRAQWDATFQGRDLADLDVATSAFAELVDLDPDDAPARYNLALCLSWLGRNADAIEALDRYVDRVASSDTEAAVDAWTLAEVLRHGAGAEYLADDFSASVSVPWPDDPVDPASLDQAGLIVPRPIPIDPAARDEAVAGAAVFEWFSRPMPDPSDVRSAEELPRAFATIIHRPGTLQISTTAPADRFEVESRLAQAMGTEAIELDWSFTPLPLRFLDADVWTFRLPPGLDDETRHHLTLQAVARYYEDRWVHRSRIGLGPSPDSADRTAITPLQAGRLAAEGNAVARARLEGVIRVREQLAARPRLAVLSGGYSFDRLRRRVGLEPIDPKSIDEADLSCAGPAELDRLDPETLDPPALAEAYRSASVLRLDAVAARLAAVLSDRDPSALDRSGIAHAPRRNNPPRHPDRPEASP